MMLLLLCSLFNPTFQQVNPDVPSFKESRSKYYLTSILTEEAGPDFIPETPYMHFSLVDWDDDEEYWYQGFIIKQNGDLCDMQFNNWIGIGSLKNSYRQSFEFYKNAKGRTLKHIERDIYCPGGKPMVIPNSFYLSFLKKGKISLVTYNMNPSSYEINDDFTIKQDYQIKLFSKSAAPRAANTIFVTDGNPKSVHYDLYFSDIIGLTDKGELWNYERNTGGFKMYQIFTTVDANTKVHSATVLDEGGFSGVIFVMEDTRARSNKQISVHFVDWDDQGNFEANWQYYGNDIPSNFIIGPPSRRYDLTPEASGAIFFVNEFGVEGSVARIAFNTYFFNPFEPDQIDAETRDVYNFPYTEVDWKPTKNYKMVLMITTFLVVFIPTTPQSTFFACQLMFNSDFCGDTRRAVLMPPQVPFISAEQLVGIDQMVWWSGRESYLAVKKRFDEPAHILKFTTCKADWILQERRDIDLSEIIFRSDIQSDFCINPEDESTVEEVLQGSVWNRDYLRYQQCNDPKCQDCSADVSTCKSCKTDYKFNSNGVCNLCDDNNCRTCIFGMSEICLDCEPGFIVNTDNRCVANTVAATCTRVDKDDNSICTSCSTGYTTSTCTSCATGYAKDSSNVCQPVCSFESCICTTPGTCPSCKAGFDGPKCLKTEDSCKADIVECTTCQSATVCKTCGVTTFTEGKSCEYCITGYIPDMKDPTKCVAVDLSENEDVFDSLDGTAEVEFSTDASVFNPTEFQYTIFDETNGQSYNCAHPKCRATVDPANEKVLRFTFDPSFTVFKGYATVTYRLNTLAANRPEDTKTARILQTATTPTGASASPNATGSFTIDNVHLTGKNTRSSAKTAHNAYTSLNAIRFFSTLILSVLNTAHAFWATNVFSWLQVWALLRGSYLVYPERFLAGHSNWFLLVIDFGEPWRDWADWHTGKTLCKVNSEYPLNKLGCSMTDTFGQNIIVIICVFAFCLVFGILYLLFVRKSGDSQSNVTTSNHQMTWGQRFTMGLGFNFFLRWLQAIQPSLIFFAITQWYSFKDTSKMGLGVFWAIFFFIYFFAVAVFSVLLALKVWAEVRDNKNNIQDQSLEWTARRVGGFLSGYAFLYCDLKTVTGLWQLFYPVVDYLRAILVSVFIIAVDTNDKTSLGLVLLVELLRMVYHTALFKQKLSAIYGILDFATGILLILYLILKNSVVNESNQRRAQEAVGSALGLFIGMIWAACLFDMVYDLFAGLAMFTDEKPTRDYAAPEERAMNIATLGPTEPAPAGDQSYRMGDVSRREMEEGPSRDEGVRAVAARPVARANPDQDDSPNEPPRD